MHSIKAFEKITYKPIYLIRLMNDLNNSYLTNELKEELLHYTRMISLVIKCIKEIKNKEIEAIKNNNKPNELFPIVRRSIEYYSKNSSYYIYYCRNANLNDWDFTKDTIIYNTLIYRAIILVNSVCFFVIFFIMCELIISFLFYNELKLDIFSNRINIILLCFFTMLFSIIIIFLYATNTKRETDWNNNDNDDKACILTKSNNKDKLNTNKKINKKYNLIKYLYFTLCFLTFNLFLLFYNQELPFLKIFLNQSKHLLSEFLDIFLYLVLSLSLLVYWLFSFDVLTKEERKITKSSLFKNVIPQIFCFPIFLFVTILLRNFYNKGLIENYTRLILLILIFIWIFLILFEPVIYNLFSFATQKTWNIIIKLKKIWKK
ncbi:hypothetical protein MFERI11561_00796 [Mycoplasma feriruminatoris]|nr:hypothetical protein MFERI11561_00796 [Mycoplasma feriruminatoris]